MSADGVRLNAVVPASQCVTREAYLRAVADEPAQAPAHEPEPTMPAESVFTRGLLDALRAGQPTWMDDAACAGVDPDLFFPERGESTAMAKAVCATCPVSEECLDYAIAGGEKFGIWGGKSERARRGIRRVSHVAERRYA